MRILITTVTAGAGHNTAAIAHWLAAKKARITPAALLSL
jgi:hypothetical protein